jgi:hypothetical protein
MVSLLATAVAVVGLTGCNWLQYQGGGPLTGETVGETTITPANVASLAPSFSVPIAGYSMVVSAPTVGGSTLYVTSDSQLIVADTSGAGCVGSPGVCAPLWTADLGPNTIGGSSQPVLDGGTVFVSTFRGSGGLFAFDAGGVVGCGGAPKVCQPRWTAAVASEAGPNVVGGVLYVVDGGTHELKAFDAAGVTNCGGVPVTCLPLWTAPVSSSSVPSVAGGRVFVATSSGPPAIQAFDAAGTTGCTGAPKVCTPLFSITLPGTSYGSVAVAAGIAYVQTTSGDLVAGDATGASCTGVPATCSPIWQAGIAGGPWSQATPAVAAGHVFAASNIGFGLGAVLYEFDAAGVEGCSPLTHICRSLWDSGPYLPLLAGQTSPVVSNGLVFLGGQAWDPTAHPGCTAMMTCTPAWSAPQPTGYRSTTIAYGTAFVRTRESGSALVAYRLP